MSKKIKSKTRLLLTVILLGIITICAISPLGIGSDYRSPFRVEIHTSLPRFLGSVILSIPLSINRMFSQTDNACYVSPNQTVVEWKSTYYTRRCWMSLDSMCVWPFPHKHMTFKVTIPNGSPLRNYHGDVIAATSGQEQRDWLTYDSDQWNALESNPRNRYIDFETVASNEYVVMVQTRYRMFNDVESTLGICTQQP